VKKSYYKMSEKQFVNGLRFEIPVKKPTWLIGKLSVKVNDLIEFLQQNQTEKGWVNIDLKIGRSGKPYAELNTWKPVRNKVVEEEENQEKLNNLEDEEIPL